MTNTFDLHGEFKKELEKGRKDTDFARLKHLDHARQAREEAAKSEAFALRYEGMLEAYDRVGTLFHNLEEHQAALERQHSQEDGDATKAKSGPSGEAGHEEEGDESDGAGRRE